MIDPHAALDTAALLLRADARRKTHLRRSISTADYALFHFLGRACGLLFLGAGRRSLLQRRTLMRAMTHEEMRAASRPFAANNLPDLLRQARHTHARPISEELRTIASNLIDLQVLRHQADYDHHWRPTREDAQNALELAQEAMELWAQVHRSADARLYLMSLLTIKRLAAR